MAQLVFFHKHSGRPEFPVDLEGVNKIIFVTVSEARFLHLISRVSTNSLYCFDLLPVKTRRKHTTPHYARYMFRP